MKKRYYYSSVIIILIVIHTHFYCQSTRIGDRKEPWSIRMAESIMMRRPNIYGDWDYVTGTVLRGFEELWSKTSDRKYYKYIKATVDHVVRSDGTIEDYDPEEYNIDEVQEGCMLLFLYKETGEEKYRKAAQLVRNQLKNHPRISENGF